MQKQNIKLVGGTIYGITRCSHCGVSNPLITKTTQLMIHDHREHVNFNEWYFCGVCSKCNHQILFHGWAHRKNDIQIGEPHEVHIFKYYPESISVDENIPIKARDYLSQALESLHAPDGAVMLSASAIDAMLKDQGYSNKKESLYNRIEMACSDGLLTESMRDWAHEIRLSANDPRHADEDFEGSTKRDAEQTLAFAQALGEYLYVLPARVKKWKSKVK
jgi:Domain of unknown function (DUF4145)